MEKENVSDALKVRRCISELKSRKEIFDEDSSRGEGEPHELINLMRSRLDQLFAMNEGDPQTALSSVWRKSFFRRIPLSEKRACRAVGAPRKTMFFRHASVVYRCSLLLSTTSLFRRTGSYGRTKKNQSGACASSPKKG